MSVDELALIMEPYPGILRLDDFDWRHHEVSFCAASRLEVSRDGLLEPPILNVSSMLESSRSHSPTTCTSILLGVLIRLKCIDDGLCLAVDWVFNVDGLS